MSNPIAYHRVRTENGTYEVPIFSINDPTILNKSLKVMTHAGLGCYDLVDDVPTNNFPLKVTIEEDGIPINKIINGVVPIVKPLSVNNSVIYSDAIITANNSEYFQVRTPWVGDGLIMPISLLPNHIYEFTFNFEVILNTTGECFVQVGIYNLTKNAYMDSWFIISQSIVGVKHSVTGRTNTASISKGDMLELEFFHSNTIDDNKDIPFEFRLFKDKNTIKLV